MSAVFGLMSTKDLESRYSETARRKVFYRYPEGKFPLMGLLSLLDGQETDKPKFGWWEHREQEHYSITAQSSVGAGNVGPFTNAANSALQTTAGFNIAVNAQFCVKVADASKFRTRDVVWLKNVPQGTTATILLQPRAIVDEILTGNVLVLRAVNAVSDISNDTDANGISVLVIGTAAAEGARSRTGNVTFPLEVENFTQIHRTSFNLTGNALKAGVRFDKTGIYKHKAKENMLRHMELLEKAGMFGERGVNNVVNDDGDTTPERTAGGILWYLQQWELGNTVNGGSFDYRPGGANITNSAWDSTDEKRVIRINGTATAAQFETLNERFFRYNGNTGGEKLVLCGNGFIKAFQQYVKLGLSVQIGLNPKEEVYGMKVFRWTTPWGDLVFKSHPLFNQNAALRNSAFVLDVGSMDYVSVEDRDTVLLKNRQNNDADSRKDEWLTECGLELHYPERHFFVDNLTGVVAS